MNEWVAMSHLNATRPLSSLKISGWHELKILSKLMWHPADSAYTCKSDAMWSLYWPQPNKNGIQHQHQHQQHRLSLSLSLSYSYSREEGFSAKFWRFKKKKNCFSHSFSIKAKRNGRESQAEYSGSRRDSGLPDWVDSEKLPLLRHHRQYFQTTCASFWKCKTGNFRFLFLFVNIFFNVHVEYLRYFTKNQYYYYFFCYVY